MNAKWNNVKNEHVLQAIKKFNSINEIIPKAKNTFLIYQNNKYPAKHVRGMAYEIANGEEISKNDYSGGEETCRFLRKLGFEIDYKKKIKINTNRSKKLSSKRINQKDVVSQKNALQIALQKKFGIIETEKKFEWLKTPNKNQLNEYDKIYKQLINYRNYKNFYKSNYQLRCDMYFESEKLIIEYDERQHFTIPRKIALENYSPKIKLFFSKDDWINSCNYIMAKDNDPKHRDEQRAFYDSVRDIEASKNGFKLIRIKHGDYDWKSKKSATFLDEILVNKNLGNRKITEIYNWRNLEIEIQRIRLNYMKWLFYFNPPSKKNFRYKLTNYDTKNSFQIFYSINGRSFSLFPSGNGSVYAGGGKGSIKLNKNCFPQNIILTNETNEIKNSLLNKTRILRKKIKEQLFQNNKKTAWEMIQNYFWLKFGLHEYAFDCSFSQAINNKDNVIRENDIRTYIEQSMLRGIDLGENIPTSFSNDDIIKLLRYKFRWNRYAICSYDCGPIAYGKGGFKTFTEIAKQRYKFNQKNNILSFGINDLRNYAVESLSNICVFAVLYHKSPISKMEYFDDFLKHKKQLRNLIIKIQNKINKLIDNEKLELIKYNFVPEM